MSSLPQRPERYALQIRALREADRSLTEQQARTLLQAFPPESAAALEQSGLESWATEQTAIAEQTWRNSPEGVMATARVLTEAKRARDEQVAAAKTVIASREGVSEADLASVYTDDQLLVAAGFAEPAPKVRRDKPVDPRRAELATHTAEERAYLAAAIAEQDARFAERSQS
jgi:hypothetical protein